MYISHHSYSFLKSTVFLLEIVFLRPCGSGFRLSGTKNRSAHLCAERFFAFYRSVAPHAERERRRQSVANDPGLSLPEERLSCADQVLSRKNPPAGICRRVLCWRYLFSRPVTRQVSSANACLTSVFGMGTGGPTHQSTPTSFEDAPSKLNIAPFALSCKTRACAFL